MENKEKLKVTVKDAFSKGLNKAGTGMESLAGLAVTTCLTSILIGATAGGVIGFNAAEQSVLRDNQKRQSAYEETVNEIAEKREQFINAGANDAALNVFDMQNPQPEKPKDKAVTAQNYADNASAGVVVGTLYGGLIGCLAGGGMAIADSIRHRKKKEDEHELTNN